ncbi:MAG: dihydrolipoyl dehydrogenase [Candidatus Aegiribacteria sp.]|nr:dihydrolipoyl dehydrogenase [Candidatus Aegiribacteria sp.]MBD3294073.1 dihydrolipoyl dehydrogenase [Candidatus Fermentibacteria bacterium]
MFQVKIQQYPAKGFKVHREVDAVIIGAGTAGLSALAQIRKRTDNFVIVNEGHYGTTCARVGCMPSKALIEAAAVYHERLLYQKMGLRLDGEIHVDGRAVMERVRKLRDGFVSGVKRATDSLDDQHNIPGHASILAPDLIEVNGMKIKTKSLIIAAGSTPVVPGPWKKLGDSLLTSDTVFEMEDLPESMAVVGLGAVGLELAQALSRLGVKVCGFDAADTVGGITDPEIAGVAEEIMQEDFPVHTGAQVKLSPSQNGGVLVEWNGERIQVEKVLAAVGRRPNTGDLGLENLGVELNDSGLPPFDENTMQVADLPVFIAGDVNQRAPILHEAADDGHIAGYNAMLKEDEKHRFCRRVPMGIVFTHPNIAYAGNKYGELKSEDTVTAEKDFSGQSRLKTAGINHGMLRLYASRSTAKLLGAEMIIPAAEHIAHSLAWVLEKELTVYQILHLPFYHPVIEEGVRGAVRKLAGKIQKKEPAPEVPLCGKLPDQSLE